MNGPGSSTRASTSRHRVMKTSSCAHVLVASALVQVDHLGAVVSYGVDLSPVVLYRSIPGDDEPALSGDPLESIPGPVRRG